MYRMFLDDERFPAGTAVSDWVIVRDDEKARDYVLDHGVPTFISFDHDLGDPDVHGTGYSFAKWLVEMDGVINIPDDFDFYVHSQNPIGKANIENYLSRYLEVKRGNG